MNRRTRALTVLVCALLLPLAGCATEHTNRTARTPDDTIRAATLALTDRCLTRQGLTPPRPGKRPANRAEEQRVAAALFGSPPAELSLTLANGIPVRAHTDGCLAAAQRTLYGDQKRWFRVSTVVNNLKPEAAHRDLSLASVRARHRAELTDWQRLRARALDASTRVLHTPTH
ncbi:hypothetical protein [Streptomyces endophyticus]|uniref:Lipoprotein n=1 Tax=Streptomyces endophyticus TaxID=714166 RepID=A0ABU6F536_9ACTN|nr:hypothetical protein [Streptomyces endophyticus]MEB8339127.1 hypothetical protein [Streptomyces endophyticus]